MWDDMDLSKIMDDEANLPKTSQLVSGVVTVVPTQEMGGTTLAVARSYENRKEGQSSGHPCQQSPTLTTTLVHNRQTAPFAGYWIYMRRLIN